MKKMMMFLTAILMIAGCSESMMDNSVQEDLVLKGAKKTECTTIQSGELKTISGVLIEPGFMESGYNYQAHIYNGEYDGDILVMKWNDAWLSNQDCDGDGLLDRHYDFPSYIGSGAWLTNHQSGEYENEDGKKCKWNYFIKIVAAPTDANLVDEIWFNAEGTEIGPEIWGEFAIIQEVYNDPCEGVNGAQYLSLDHVGFGGW